MTRCKECGALFVPGIYRKGAQYCSRCERVIKKRNEFIARMKSGI